MDDASIPEAHRLRWPILVALDEMGEEGSLLDLQGRIVRRLKLPEGIAEIGAEEGGLPLLTQHLVQALADLHAGGAVASDETGRLWITDDGRRMTEGDVDELPEGSPEDEAAEPGTAPKPTFRNYVSAVIETFFP